MRDMQLEDYYKMKKVEKETNAPKESYDPKVDISDFF